MEMCLNLDQNSALGEFFAFSESIFGNFSMRVGTKKREKIEPFSGGKKKLLT